LRPCIHNLPDLDCDLCLDDRAPEAHVESLRAELTRVRAERDAWKRALEQETRSHRITSERMNRLEFERDEASNAAGVHLNEAEEAQHEIRRQRQRAESAERERDELKEKVEARLAASLKNADRERDQLRARCELLELTLRRVRYSAQLAASHYWQSEIDDSLALAPAHERGGEE
jgi:chromosome segregation ATPase